MTPDGQRSGTHHPATGLLLLPRRPTDLEVEQMTAAADVLFLVYPNHPHSSNMLTRAARHRTAAVVPADGVMAHRVRQYGTGVVVKEDNCLEMMAGVQRCLTAPPPRTAFDRYHAAHSRRKFRDAYKPLLETLLQ